MKISKISFNSYVHNLNKHKNLQNITTPLSLQSNYTSEIFKNYFGRDMVSFGSKPFSETLKNNWFQLPNGFTPDAFQTDAGKALNEGKNVLVEAPTGTGKTAIAHYAATRNLDEGKTTFYTTPLKALSNQKLNEFRAVYGDDKVGILTGDRRENVEAPIVIMTTEVYRNMALSNMYGEKNPLMEKLGTVIFDELHYLGDESRGPVWEESIMLTPKNVQVLGLSATIGNPKDLQNWQSSLKGEDISLVSIPSEARAVPLVFDSIFTDSYKKEEKRIEKAGTSQKQYDDYIPPKPKLSDFKFAVDKLKTNEQLPAILFVFSRGFSRELLDHFAKNGNDLTTQEEKQQIEKIVNKHKANGYIGADLDMGALKKGYAIHNAGIIPNQKKLIEELFQKKLTKVVIATETLAAGINMPAKTVVISSPYKPTDAEKSENEKATRILTSNEFKQMGGRAGRRGIDTKGYVYTLPVDKTTEQDFLFLEISEANPLESKYNPDYAFLSGYYKYNDDTSKLKDFIGKSFYSYSKNPDIHKRKTQELLDISQKRTNVLEKRGFLNRDNEILTPTLKGNMASVVKGYDALGLTEAIESKKFDGITPEALAMIAGSIANPAYSEDANITSNTNIDYIFEPSTDYVNSVYKNIQTSIASKLNKLGHDMSEFDNYEEMLDFVQGLKKPDISEDTMMEELRKLGEIRAKMYTITKSTGKMTPLELMAAIKNSDIIPTKVLEDNLKSVEQYKKRINARTIDDYINKLNAELEANNSEGKGKKAKARMEKKCEEIQKEIDYAQAMKYLDENIYGVISSNYQFIKKNPPQQVKDNYNEAEKQWIKLTSKDTLVSQIKALIGIEKYSYDHDIEDEAQIDNDKVRECINIMEEKAFDILKTEDEEGIASKPKRYGRIGAQMLYNWALLNKVSSDSMSNWQQLLKTLPEDSHIDEGSIYRNILQTADLLSQIAEITEAGCKNSQDEQDISYYEKLGKCASEARKLIIQYPIEI